MTGCAWVLAVSMAFILPVSPAAAADAEGSFDGQWLVRLDCPNHTEDSGARGYKYEFTAAVTRGFLSGSHGEEGAAGSLRIEGPINPSGDAMLQARGRTANPEFAVNRPSSGTPYSYRIKAHFDDTKGTGSRLEARVCNFNFSRIGRTLP